jgi:predicted NodU family carbamoyl transferase
VAVDWVPFATFVAGAAFTLVGDWARSFRETKKEQRARHASFQRETLLELQEVLSDLLRSSGQAEHADEMAYRQAGAWGRNQIPEEVSDQLNVRQRRVRVLAERVDDEDARRLATDVVDRSLDREQAKSQASSQQATIATITVFKQANERLGHLARQLG